jgi:carboxylate-amine ligase
MYGTLEIRVPDAQSSVADAAGVASVAHALVVWLAERYDAGGARPAAAAWRIEENRWSACRDGPAGVMADLETGERTPTHLCLERLLDRLEPVARRLNAAAQLEHARLLTADGGAAAQRRAGGPRAATRSLVERFLAARGSRSARAG